MKSNLRPTNATTAAIIITNNDLYDLSNITTNDNSIKNKNLKNNFTILQNSNVYVPQRVKNNTRSSINATITRISL